MARRSAADMKKHGYQPETDGLIYDVITKRPGKPDLVEHKTLFQVFLIVKTQWERLHYPDACTDSRLKTMMARLQKDHHFIISNVEVLRP
jgi:hypothetical protein